MAFLSSSQEADISVEFRDRRGNPARVDGVPEWMTDNATVVNLTLGQPREQGATPGTGTGV
jgi:hypothetical protein